ncbi:MAG TPA: aldose epimerase family protein [Bacillota bacterium]|nr:aldose epimerase family protein [Bacillota bacterium]HOK69024.1 aldose epimerase family protein [Bacillota bacterium]HPP84620.1 aldose epimerase family protein [Bacillota bacterium]
MIKTNRFGKIGNEDIICFTLENDSMKADILNYGGILRSLVVNGADVVCGFDDLEGYLADTGYHGAVIGRYANRIENGVFSLNGTEYHLNRNEKGVTHLHGGNKGFDKAVWKYRASQFADGSASLALSHFSPDGDEGYPGNLQVEVVYTLSGKSLTIHYRAKSDRDTVVNLTNHSYFNLNGYDSGDIYSHVLKINADKYCTVDERLIPVREADVSGTPFDFRTPKPVGQDIFVKNRQLEICGGYDHNFILNKQNVDSIRTGRKVMHEAAVLSAEKNTMTVYTDMPCLQLYTANFMTGERPFKNGVKQEKHRALCLETQFAPNSPNNGEAILKKGVPYDRATVFVFK